MGENGVLTDPLMLELSGVLHEALGSPENECNPQVDDYLLADGDQLLLCTDGLTDMVNDTEIEMVLNSAANAKSACRSLIDLAWACIRAVTTTSPPSWRAIPSRQSSDVATRFCQDLCSG
jgi:serine/threonine protein phosphatase PrpC